MVGDDVAALHGLLQQVAVAHEPHAEHARSAYLGPADTVSVTRQQLLERMDQQTVLVIDVRPAKEYAYGHIPGAVSLPLDNLEARSADLPNRPDIVVYGRSANCVLAHDAVRRLSTCGRMAMRLTDGILEWRAAYVPLERSDVPLPLAPS